MSSQKEKILEIKAKRIEKHLSPQDVYNIVIKKGYDISKSSVSRVFKEGSENLSFRYKETLEPIEKALEDDPAEEETKIKAIKEYYEKEISAIIW